MGPLKAVVLGCGPAGLLAAHGIHEAAKFHGQKAEVRIYSVKRRSPLYGCQYLHAPIPGLGQLEMQEVQYRLTGSISGYRDKVYGLVEDVAVSPELLESNHFAWNIRQAYDALWEKYESSIHNFLLSAASWSELEHHLTTDNGFDLIISTVPAPALCYGHTCTFESQHVWAMGDAPELGRTITVPPDLLDLPNATILCNGFPDIPWYRASHVFNHRTIEWPEEEVVLRGASRVNKPIKTTCECNPEIFRSGRYARWEKGVLSHQSYFDGYFLARDILER